MISCQLKSTQDRQVELIPSAMGFKSLYVIESRKSRSDNGVEEFLISLVLHNPKSLCELRLLLPERLNLIDLTISD